MLDDRRRRRWCNGNRGWRCGLGRRCRRLDCLDEARRAEDWCRRLGWFGLLRRRCFLRCGGLGWNGVLGEHVAARKRDVPLSREPFDENKLRRGLTRALEKRPVSVEAIESAVTRIMHNLRTTGEREIPSLLVGEEVMKELRHIDGVAYVRFASVYRDFQDVREFQKEIQSLTGEQNSGRS